MPSEDSLNSSQNRYHTAMDQDSWIARHKLLAAFLLVVGGSGGGFLTVWLLTVVL